MTRTIVGKEVLANLLSYKFHIVLLLTVVLLLTSFFIMHRDFQNRLADYQVIRPKPGEPIALVPPNPLSILAKGLDEAMGRSFEVGVTGITVRAGQTTVAIPVAGLVVGTATVTVLELGRALRIQP